MLVENILLGTVYVNAVSIRGKSATTIELQSLPRSLFVQKKATSGNSTRQKLAVTGESIHHSFLFYYLAVAVIILPANYTVLYSQASIRTIEFRSLSALSMQNALSFAVRKQRTNSFLT